MSIEGAPRTRRRSSRLTSSTCWPPRCPEGQVVVVLDGLGAHRRTQRVRELIEARSADLLFLPSSYSPELNPIEEAFSKIKNIVRKAGARTREALVGAIGLALSAVTLEDVEGWFAHCAATTHGINTHELRCKKLEEDLNKAIGRRAGGAVRGRRQADLGRMHREYLRARPPDPGREASAGYRMRMPTLELWNKRPKVRLRLRRPESGS